MEEWRSAAYCFSPHGLCRLFSYLPQDHLPESWPHPQWAGSSHINPQLRKHSTGFPTDQSGGDIFSIEVFSTQMSLACVDRKQT